MPALADDVVATKEAWQETLGWFFVKFGLDLDQLTPFEKAQLTLLARIARAVESKAANMADTRPLPNVDSFMGALRGDGDCECVCEDCLQDDHCDRASCAS